MPNLEALNNASDDVRDAAIDIAKSLNEANGEALQSVVIANNILHNREIWESIYNRSGTILNKASCAIINAYHKYFSVEPKNIGAADVHDALNDIKKSIYGDNGDDQQRIAETGVAWLNLLLKKNKDYGSSVWNPPILKPSLSSGDSILVRMSDKVKRIALLTDGSSPHVTDETLEDTIRDLGAYCLLYLARPK